MYGGGAGAPFGAGGGGGPVVQPYGYPPGPAGPPQPFGYPPGPAGPMQPIITQPGMPPANPHPGMGPGGPAGASITQLECLTAFRVQQTTPYQQTYSSRYEFTNQGP